MKSSIKRGIYIHILALVLLLCIQAPVQCLAQSSDSLEIKLKKSTAVERLSLLYSMAEFMLSTDMNEAIIYANRLLREAENQKDQQMITNACLVLGEAYYTQNEPKKAIDNFERALSVSIKLKDKKQISSAYNSLGIVSANADPEKALDYYQKSLKIKYELDDKQGISAALNNIGTLFERKLKNLPKALEYYKQSLAMDQELKNEEGVATSLLNIGDVYRQMRRYGEAVDYCSQSLAISEKNKFTLLCELNYESLYKSYKTLGNWKEALKYNELFSNFKFERFDQNLRQQIAEMEIKFQSVEQSKKIALLNKENEIAKKENKSRLIIIYSLIIAVVIVVYFLSALTGKSKKIRKANEAMHLQAIAMEMTNRELEKLSAIAARTDNSVVVANAEGEIEWVNDGFTRMLGVTFEEFAQRYSSNFFTASLNPHIREVVDEAVRERKAVTYSSYTVTRIGREIWIHTTLTPIVDEAGKLLKIIAIDADVTRIKQAEKELTLKNMELTDSIMYAQRIQETLLPPESHFRQVFTDHFIFYRPRDIVSGDFYWMNLRQNKIVLAVADCTGHGIPGAFMSLLGISMMNEIMNSIPETENLPGPNELLNTLREKVKYSMRQSGDFNEMHDGMDISLCIIDPANHVLDYSGAYHHLFRVHAENGKPSLTEYEGDNMPIGEFPKDYESFTRHTIRYNEDDCFYMLTDGYAHQWGGPNNKKFTRKRFRELILRIHNRPLAEQKVAFAQTLEAWMQAGDPSREKIFQIDDIVVIGFRV